MRQSWVKSAGTKIRRTDRRSIATLNGFLAYGGDITIKRPKDKYSVTKTSNNTKSEIQGKFNFEGIAWIQNKYIYIYIKRETGCVDKVNDNYDNLKLKKCHIPDSQHTFSRRNYLVNPCYVVAPVMYASTHANPLSEKCRNRKIGNVRIATWMKSCLMNPHTLLSLIFIYQRTYMCRIIDILKEIPMKPRLYTFLYLP